MKNHRTFGQSLFIIICTKQSQPMPPCQSSNLIKAYGLSAIKAGSEQTLTRKGKSSESASLQ